MSASSSAKPVGPPHVVFWPLWALGLAGTVFAFLLGGEWLRDHDAPPWTGILATIVYCLAITAIASLPCLYILRRHRVELTSVRVRFLALFMGGMTLYGVVLTGVIFTFVYLRPTGPAAWALAALPALPLIACFFVLGAYMRAEMDEFLRAMTAESGLWATGAVLTICTVWGFLEQFMVAPHVPAWAVFPLWGACLGVAGLFVRLRYR